MANKYQLKQKTGTIVTTNFTTSGSSSTTSAITDESSLFEQYSNKGNGWSGTAYDYTVRRNSGLNGSYRETSRADSAVGFLRTGYFGQATVITPGDAALVNTNAKNMAYQSCLSRIGSVLNLSTNVAEIDKAYQQLRHPLQGVASAVEAAFGTKGSSVIAKRGSRQNYRRDLRYAPDRHSRTQAAADGVSSAWLEVQFAVKPLLYDMYEIIGTLNDRSSDAGKTRRKVTGKGKDSVSSTSVVYGGIGYAPSTCVSEYTSIATVTALVNPPAATRAKLAQTYFSMNPYRVAWELTPASWLVDYLWDVSGYLQAIDNARTYNKYVEAAWESSLRITTSMHQVVPTYVSGPLIISSQVTGFGRQVRFTRTPMSAIPIPSRPVGHSASSKSANQYANIVAAIAQKIL
jgi:hypothetical protein